MEAQPRTSSWGYIVRVTQPLRTVVLIEDDPHIQRVARLALERVGGLEVQIASSGEGGIELVSRSQPDLVLLDVMMPGMDGLTTLAGLRERPETRLIPVVFLTAKVQRKEVDRLMASGAIGVIQKPFDPMTLAEQVRAIVEGAR